MRTEIDMVNGRCPNYVLNGYVWKPKGDVQVVLHIVHGMTEHMGRYEESPLLSRRLLSQHIIFL